MIILDCIQFHAKVKSRRKRYTTLESVKDDIFLTWMYMLDRGYEDEEEMKELSEMTEGMRNFAEQYGIAINDPKFAKLYEEYSDALHEEASRLAFAENTGLKKGREEGRAEGRAEGQDSIIRMVDYLISQNRYDDLKRATEDAEFRKKILEEIEGSES